MFANRQVLKLLDSTLWFSLLAIATTFLFFENQQFVLPALTFSLLFAMGPVFIYGREEKSAAFVSLALFWLMSALALLASASIFFGSTVLLACAAAWWSVAASITHQLTAIKILAARIYVVILLAVAVLASFLPTAITLVVLQVSVIVTGVLLIVVKFGYQQEDNQALLSQCWWPVVLACILGIFILNSAMFSLIHALLIVSAGFWIQVIFFYRHWLAERHAQQQHYQHRLEYQVQERTLELEVTLRELQEKNDELSRLSSTDALTGTRNRRYFDTRLVAESRRARREQTRLSLAMIDIDHFKKINDTYGHAVGDACIRHVANVLRLLSRRASDDVCRYGGEEFALILPNTDSQGALQLAEAMRVKLEAFPVEVEGHRIPLTVSIGICTGLMTEEEQEIALLRRADHLLYEAKRAGRNCVKVGLLEEQDD